MRINKTTMNAFLTANNSFELSRFNFNDTQAVANLNIPKGAKRETLINALKALQRLNRITDNLDEAIALYDQGFHSSLAITHLSETAFIANFTPANTSLTDRYKQTIYQRAQAQKTAVMMAYMNVADQSSPYYRNTRFNNLSAHTDAALSHLPNYDDLFGNQNYCECEQCRTIFSPAAYFVDLMRLQSHYLTISSKSASISLTTRRPDLETIELSCKNTNTLLPKLEIVSKVLLHAAKLGSIEKLSTQNYPLNLPYNDAYVGIETYLQNASTTLGDVWKNMLPKPSPTQVSSIASAALGLSIEQWTLYSTPNTQVSTLAQYYGVTKSVKKGDTNGLVKTLSNIDTFLSHTQLTGDQLRELIYGGLSKQEIALKANLAFYINDEQKSPITIDEQSQQLIGLNTQNLDRLHRFIRLARKLNWSFTELDWALRTCALITNNKLTISDDILPILAWLHKTHLDLPTHSINSLCAMIGLLNDTGKGFGSSFFESVFDNPSIPNPPKWLSIKKGLTWNVPKGGCHAQTAQDKQIQAALAAALKLSQSDLLRIANERLIATKSKDGSLAMDLEELSIFYRLANLHTIAGRSFDETWVTLSMLKQDNNPLLALCSTAPSLTVFHALQTLFEVTTWLSHSPVSIYQIQFMLEGTSHSTEINNMALNAQDLSSFVLDLHSSIKPVLLTEEKFITNIQSIVTADRSLAQQLWQELIKNQNVAPNGLVLSLAKIKDNLLTYLSKQYQLQQQTLYQQLSGLFSIDPDTLPTLVNWSSTHLLDTLITGQDSATQLRQMRTLQRYIIFTHCTTLNRVELDAINTHPSIFNIAFGTKTTPQIGPTLTIENIICISKFKHLTQSFDDTDNRFIRTLLSANGASKDNSPTKRAKSIQDFTQWQSKDILFLFNQSALWDNPKNPGCTIADVLTLNRYFSAAFAMNINVVSLMELVDLASIKTTSEPSYYTTLTQVSNFLQAALQNTPTSKNTDGIDHHCAENIRLSARRDALVPYTIHCLNQANPAYALKTSNDLSEYLLIDVDSTPALQTSLIKDGICSVQRYLYRCLNHLEPGVSAQQALIDQWAWMAHYRTWQENREIFVFPENYLQPELRQTKTQAFTAFEHALKQADIRNPNTIESAYQQYLDSFANIANMTILSGATHDNIDVDNGESAKTLFLLGQTLKAPHQYYYTEITFSYHSDKEHFLPTAFAPWKHIDIPLTPTGTINACYALGKWFLFWVEHKQVGMEMLETASGQSHTQHFNASIMYSYLNFKSEWVAPHQLGQSISVPPQAISGSQVAERYWSAAYPVYFHSTKSILVYFANRYLQYTLPGNPLISYANGFFRYAANHIIKQNIALLDKPLSESNGFTSQYYSPYEVKNTLNIQACSLWFNLRNYPKKYTTPLLGIGKNYLEIDKKGVLWAGNNHIAQLKLNTYYHFVIANTERVQNVQKFDVNFRSLLEVIETDERSYMFFQNNSGQIGYQYVDTAGDFSSGAQVTYDEGKKTTPIHINMSVSYAKFGLPYSFTCDNSGRINLFFTDDDGHGQALFDITNPDTVVPPVQFADDTQNIIALYSDNETTLYWLTSKMYILTTTIDSHGNASQTQTLTPKGAGIILHDGFVLQDTPCILFYQRDDSTSGTYLGWMNENRQFEKMLLMPGGSDQLSTAQLGNKRYIIWSDENANGYYGWIDVNRQFHKGNHGMAFTKHIGRSVYDKQVGHTTVCDEKLFFFSQFEGALYVGYFDKAGNYFSGNESEAIANNVWDGRSYSKQNLIQSFTLNNQMYCMWVDDSENLHCAHIDTATSLLLSSWPLKENIAITVHKGDDPYYYKPLFVRTLYGQYFAHLSQAPGQLTFVQNFPLCATQSNTDKNTLIYINNEPPIKIPLLRFGTFLLGKDATNVPFDGQMQEVVTYARNLTADDVSALYENAQSKLTQHFDDDVSSLDSAFSTHLEKASLPIINQPNWQLGSIGPCNLLAIPYGNTDPSALRCLRLNSVAFHALSETLLTQGIDGLLSITSQRSKEVFDTLNPNPTVIPTTGRPSENIDFNSSLLSEYYWEIFFHIPFLIANELHLQQQFQSAKGWYERIFNPTVNPLDANLNPKDTSQNDQYWRFVGLRSFMNKTLATELNESLDDEIAFALSTPALLNQYHNDPFDPHAIARLRPIVYQKTLAMHYIDNLISWGDYLFKQYTIENIVEAAMLYMTAENLLGKKPRNTGKCQLPTAENLTAFVKKYQTLGHIPEFLIDLEQSQTRSSNSSALALAGFSPNDYFGLPENQQFLSYWDTIAKRLFDIRHNYNIDGVYEKLPLFQPPINPVNATTIQKGSNGNRQPLRANQTSIPFYRFKVVMNKAQQMTDTVISLGQSLLHAIEKQSAESLSILYNTNERNIVRLTALSRQAHINEIQQSILALETSLESAQSRYAFYATLIDQGLSSQEKTQLTLGNDAVTAQLAAQPIKGAAIAGYLLPTIFGFSDGGFKPGDAIGQGAAISEGVANEKNMSSGLAGTTAALQRRAQQWQLQVDQAQDDIKQIEHQLSALQCQLTDAKQALLIVEQHNKQLEKVAQFLTTKFTNEQLYRWMSGRLSSLYFQAYELALDYALQAERAWQFERGTQQSIIATGQWNSLQQGLLAGESLQLGLKQLENLYFKQDERRLEIVKTITLSEDNITSLKQSGSCHFTLSKADFDQDYDGHYCRQIKSISVSIPLLVGPYTNLQASLIQTSSTTWLDAAHTQSHKNLFANQQVALSKGINDSGLFELNFQDDRYLPFEGTGAISSWELTLNIENKDIDFSTLTDVIVEIKYTARTK